MIPRKIVILGANAAGRIAAYTASYDKSIEVIGFTDPNPRCYGQSIFGKPVLGGDDKLTSLRESGVKGAVIAAGEPQIRAYLRNRVIAAGLHLVNLTHPSAVISPATKLGAGTVVLAGAVLSDNPIVGMNCWIGLSAVVTHDTTIGDDCLIGGRSAVGAEVQIGDRTVIGWGAVIGPRRRVGADSAVGFGSNVVFDIPDCVTAVGNPAAVIKQRSGA